jgi:hypothetical protein
LCARHEQYTRWSKSIYRPSEREDKDEVTRVPEEISTAC